MIYKDYEVTETKIGYKCFKDDRESKTYENKNDIIEAIDLNKVIWTER